MCERRTATVQCRTMSDGNLLQTFWSLSSLSDEERIKAAKELITSLTTHQAQHEGEGLCSELEYSLKRLVRGLASNRKAARHGYFITFTELLVQFPQVQLSEIHRLIHTHLESTGGIKGHEERGIYFGRIFALLALLRSGRLKTTEDALSIMKQIYLCAQKKSFLQELCVVTVGQLISECNFSDDVIRDHVIPLVGVTSGWEECTPERLYTVLLLSKQLGKEKWFKEILKTKWNSKNVCSRVNFSKLASILLGSSSSHPRLHSVWPLVLETVRGKDHFGEFWKTAVDDSLFTSSHERKYVGFQLLEMVLPSLSVGEVPLVFSTNLLRCVVNNASSQENYLHPAAKHLLSELTSFLESNVNQSLSITIMLHLQRRTGGKFDQLTGSKVTETILSQLDEGGVDLLVGQLQEMFCDPISAIISEDSDEEGCGDAHSMQLWVLEQLLAVVRNPHLPRTDSWLLSIARFLLLHAYFEATTQLELLAKFKVQAVKAPLEKLVVDNCNVKLISVLSDLSGLSLRQQPLPPPAADRVGGRFGPPGVTKDGRFFLIEVLKFVKEMMSLTDDGVAHRQPFSDEKTMQAWATVCEAVETLSQKEELSSEEKSFLLLYSNLGLQLLSPREREGTAHSIEELKVCQSEMELAVGKKGRTPKKKKRKTVEEEDAPSWMEVLTDMLLGFLSQPSQLWRNVTEQVFKLVSNHVTLASLQLILGVLEPKTSKEELMENEEEDSEDNGSTDQGEGSEMDEDERGSVISEDGGSEGSEGGEEQGEDVDPVFRADVQKALGAAAVNSDAESESSLDDDAMMAVDDALAAVFRTRFAMKHQRKKKKDEAKSVLHFKLRVLDLVELYIRKESTNPLVLDLVVPLYELIHAAQSQKESSPLVKRASGIFKNRLCHLKDYPKADFDVDHIHSHLQQMIQYLYKVNPLTVPLVTQGCMFLLRVLRGTSAPPIISPLTTRAGKKRKREEATASSEGETAAVVVRGEGVLKVELVNGWVGDALHDFITRKNSNVPPSFFTTYIERYPVLASQLGPRMVEHLPSSASHFKKTQIIEMLKTLKGMDLLGSEIAGKLTNEDAEAVVSASTKTKKRKRSKHKKQRTSDYL